jgi:hypothetical protein
MLTALLLGAQVASAPPAVPSCAYDRAALLALAQPAFDQDMTGGWRALANRGCGLAAADLIRDWRAVHPMTPSHASILFWHEGQLRANAGQDAAAISLFDQSRKTPADDHGLGWNLYVDGSIAFIRRDRTAFEAARAALAALPRPADFDPRGPDGKPMAIAWPINLNVLDGMAACWNEPYRNACVCVAPKRRITEPGT